MSDPQRFLESSSAASRLLRAGLRDNPQPRAAQRAALALGLGSASAVAAGTASALAEGAVAAGSLALAAQGAATATSAAGASIGVTSLAAKWLVVGLIGGGIAAGGAASISDRTPILAPARQTPTGAPAEPARDEHRATPSRTLPFASPEPAPAAPDKIARHDFGAVAVVPTVGKPRSTPHAPKPAAPQRAARSGDSSGDSLGGLGRDLSQIDQTRRALRSGDASGAQALLDAYERGRETSFFDREAVVLRIEALVQQGQQDRAAKLASDYFRRFPNDVHAPRLRALLQGARTPKEPGAR